MIELLVDVRDGVGTLTLNRPRVINALNLEMLEGIGEALTGWSDDARVERVLLTGAGERGLCSGADVRALREQLLVGGDPVPFFEVEYQVDALIAEYPKPITADMFGMVMGGGLGLSAHASDRVLGPDSVLAMPETIIGLFPDVGVMYELSRAPGELGTHLALLGVSIGAADALLVGLADRCQGTPQPGILPGSHGWIDECYAGDDPVRIVNRLEQHPDAAARDAGAILRRRSPFGVCVTLAALRRARGLASVRDVLTQDLRLAPTMVSLPDFAEGVRAQLVDKDRTPRWRHGRIEDVDPAEVAALFG